MVYLEICIGCLSNYDLEIQIRLNGNLPSHFQLWRRVFLNLALWWRPYGKFQKRICLKYFLVRVKLCNHGGQRMDRYRNISRLGCYLIWWFVSKDQYRAGSLSRMRVDNQLQHFYQQLLRHHIWIYCPIPHC